MRRPYGAARTTPGTLRHRPGQHRRGLAALGVAAVLTTTGTQVTSVVGSPSPPAAGAGGGDVAAALVAGPAGGWTGAPPQAATVATALSRPATRAGPARTVAAIGAPTQADLTDIPAPALAAYQRAETVLDEARPSCGLRWELLAAIGRVESDHGRHAGGALRQDGRVVPPIIGVALTGADGTRRVGDSDAGQLDGDRRADRAVGPMQFLPSTWSVVGVDADGDDQRDPQDVDDAALAAAVYLCGGGEDLTERTGLEAAVLTYNRSRDYVDTVLALMRAYSEDSPASSVATETSVAVAGPEAALPEGPAPAGAAPLVERAQDSADRQRRREARSAARGGASTTSGQARGADGPEPVRPRTPTRPGGPSGPGLPVPGGPTVPAGPVGPAGPTPSEPAGPPSGPPGGEPSGPPSGEPSGPPSGEPSGPPGGEPSGGTGGEPTGGVPAPEEPGGGAGPTDPPATPQAPVCPDPVVLDDGTSYGLADLLADPTLLAALITDPTLADPDLDPACLI